MKIALMFSNDELATQLKSSVEAYTPHTVEKHTATVYNEALVDKLARMRAILSEDYDLIQTDELIGNGPFGLLTSRLKEVPVAGYLRGWGDYTNDHEQYGPGQMTKIRLKSQACFSRMDGMAAISNAVIGGVRNDYRTDGITVLERPYNVEYYSSGESDLFSKPTILTVTNLRYEEKYEGVKTIIEGVKPILGETDLFQVAVAGGGRYLEQLEEYVSTQPEREQIKLLGHRDDVPDLLSSAELFVYTSFLDGRPSTVYEAQAAGLPIIAGDAAGVPEAVGDAGEIVPPTPDGIESGVRCVLDDAGFRDRLRARSEVKMQTHNKKVATQWADFWEGIV